MRNNPAGELAVSVEEELARFSPEKDTILTIGVFDGVHLGHQSLLSELKTQARQRNFLSGVVTFKQHPQEILSPQNRLPILTGITEKTALLKNEGIDIVVTLSFTRELSQFKARDFINFLMKHLRMKGLVVGADFALGKDKEGNINNLQELGREFGFSVTVVPPVKIKGEIVSSTVIRKALGTGDMRKVRKLMGHFPSVMGEVIPGDHRGTGLGFPTANIDADVRRALPPDGVYATVAHLDGKIYDSMTDVGSRPTFGGGKRLIEIYILDYKGDLYHREIQVDFIDRLRDEKRFDSVEELKKQIAEDVERGRAILSEIKHDYPGN